MPRIDSSIARRPVLAGAGLCLLLAACGDGGQQPVPAAGVSMDPNAWAVNSQTPAYGMPSQPTAASGSGWQVDLPIGAAQVGQEPSLHSVLTNAKLKLSGEVTMTMEVQASPDVKYYGLTEATNSTSCPMPPTARLLLQRVGDNLSLEGEYRYYRWWSNQGVELKPGTYTQTLAIPVQPSNWGPEKQDDKFAEAMVNIGTLGVVFGSNCAYGHGLRVTQGSARVIVRSFEAN